MLKFTHSDQQFHESIKKISALDIPKSEFIHGFPLFTGHVNLARYLFFYEMYKQVSPLAGDLADVGTWKGYSFMYFAKLVQIFEPYTNTRVHAYDWFQGMKTAKHDDKMQEGKYIGDYDMLCNLVEMQGFSDVTIINKLNLTKDLPHYFENNNHLRFKLCFIDCGIKDVLEESLKYFFPRIVPSGILIMDHYNSEVSPYESEIVEKYTTGNIIRQCQFVRQPTAYVIKER